MPTATLEDLGRRERKKIETRRALVDAAIALFAERGIEATTVDDIADAVDVSARTFHRYFTAKEDVLFADNGERQAAFESFLTARPSDEPLLDTLQAAVHGLTDSFLADPAAERRRMLLITTSYTLRARSLQYSDIFDGILRQHIAQRLALDPGEPLPRVLAACTIAALRAARERWLDDEHLDYHAEIDKSFALLADLRSATVTATDTIAQRASRS